MGKLPFSIYDFFGYLASGFIIFVAADQMFGYEWVFREKLFTTQAIFLIVIVYIVGHINAHFSSWLLEKNLIAKLLRCPNEILFFDKKDIHLLPHFIFPGYHTPISKRLIERINDTANDHCVAMEGENFFHHVRSTAKGSKETWARMDTFLQLYGFCRNMSFALFCSALLMSIAWLNHGTQNQGPISILALLAAIGMLYRYLKFYRQYSYEMFTAYPDIAAQSAKRDE